MDNKQPAVYILASNRNGTLYIGVTSNLIQRVWRHRNDVVDGFSKKYGTHKLVYFEQHATMADAILREKQIKKWNREWKLRLIEETNPYWHDLYAEIVGDFAEQGTGFPPPTGAFGGRLCAGMTARAKALDSRPRQEHSGAGSARE